MKRKRSAKTFLAAIVFLASGCSGDRGSLPAQTQSSGRRGAPVPTLGPDVAQEIESLIAYQRQFLVSEQLLVADYLALTKPYAIWDSRVLSQPTVLFQGGAVGSRQLPNYLWGRLGAGYFKLDRSEVGRFPDDFLRESVAALEAHRAHARASRDSIQALVQAFQSSRRSVFVQQRMLGKLAYERVDDLFRQGSVYWRWEKADPSLVFMGMRQVPSSNVRFTPAEEDLLNRLESAGCYAAVKVNSLVVLLTGGMLDNSRGYIWSQDEPAREDLGFLFHISELERVAANLFYYVSN